MLGAICRAAMVRFAAAMQGTEIRQIQEHSRFANSAQDNLVVAGVEPCRHMAVVRGLGVRVRSADFYMQLVHSSVNG